MSRLYTSSANRRGISKRNGRPAYENPPPRIRGDMREWLARFDEPAPEPEPPLRYIVSRGLVVMVPLLGVIAANWWAA